MDRRGTFFSEDHLRSTQHEAQTSYELLHGSLCAVCRTLHDQLAHTDALIQQPLLHARVNASRQPAASRSTWGQWVEPISRLHDPANDLDVETAYALLEQAKVSLPVLKVVQANAAWVEALRNSGDLAYVGAAVLYVHLQSLMLYIKTLSVALKRHQEGPDDASSYELKTFVFGAHDPKGAQYFGEAVPSREACYKANPWVDAYAALHTTLARVQASRASLSAWVVFFKDADCGKQAAFTEALHVVSEACFGSGPATWVLDWVERCVALNVLEADYQAECRAHALLERSRLKGYCAALEALDGLMGCEREHSEALLARYRLIIEGLREGVATAVYPDYMLLLDEALVLEAFIQAQCYRVARGSAGDLHRKIKAYLALHETGYMDGHLYALFAPGVLSDHKPLPEPLHRIRVFYMAWLFRVGVIMGDEQRPHEGFVNERQIRRSSFGGLPSRARHGSEVGDVHYAMSCFLLEGASGAYRDVWGSAYSVPRFLAYLMLASHVRSFMLTQLRLALGAAPVQAASLGASLPSERVCVPTQALAMHCQGFCAARLEQLAYYTALGAPPAGCPLEALCVYLNALNGLAAQHQAQGAGCDEQKCEGTSSGVLDCVHAADASGWLDGEEEARDGGGQSLGARLSVCFR